MIITKFNAYFDKHGKATYLVLCIIIAVIFVFTVGSGDSGCSGQERLSSLGTLNGQNLATDDFMRKSSQLRLSYAMNNQRLPGRVGDFEMAQMVVERMRYVLEAKEKGMDTITDDEFAKALFELPYWSISDKDHTGDELESTETVFSRKRFTRFLKTVVKGQYRLTGEDFDEMLRENILSQRVLDSAVKDVKADDAAVKTVASESVLKTAVFSLNPERDTRPSDAEIEAFLKTREKELTDKDRMTDFYLIAYCDYDNLSVAKDSDKALAAAITPTDAEVQSFFDKNASALFKGKKLDEVKEQILKSLQGTKSEEYAKKAFTAFSSEIAKAVPAKSTRFSQFRSAALKNKLKVAEQNGLPEGSFIKGIHNQQKALVEALKGLTARDVPTAMIPLAGESGDNGFAIAIKVENPNKEQNIRSAVADILRGEKALKLYEEKVVKVYEPKLAGLKTQEELIELLLRDVKDESMISPASFVSFVDVMDTVNSIIMPFILEADGKLVISKPGVRDSKLLSWYKREVANEAAAKRAAEALAGYQAALKAGKTLEAADTQKRFVDCKKAVSWQGAINSAMQMVYQQMYMSQGRMTASMMRMAQYYGLSMASSQAGVAVKNLPALIVELDKAGDNALLAQPVKGSSGYLLVYQASRALPTTDEGKKQVETAREMVLNDAKSKALEAFRKDLEQRYKVVYDERFLPSTEQASN